MLRRLIPLALLVPSLALAGCIANEEGQVAVYVKDAPTDEFDKILLRFDQVRLHRAGAEADQNDTEGPGWITVRTADQQIDLLDFTEEDSRALIGNASILAGRYDQVLIRITDARGVRVDTQDEVVIELIRPEVRLTRAFNVSADQTTRLIIDFDLDRSLVAQGNGEYRLRPVVGKILVDEDAGRLQRSVADDGVPPKIDDDGTDNRTA